MIPLLTVASAPRPGFFPFLRSCDRAGLAPLVLGYRQPWRGFGWRLKAVHQALRGLRGPVLMLDAHDVVVVAREEELLRRYRSMGAELVYAAETNCWPDPHLAERYPPAETRFRYLNGGGWMGEAGYMAALLERAGIQRLPDEANDQAFMTELFLANPDVLRLDTRCELFQCLYEAGSDLEISERGVYNRVSGTWPAVVHGNGGTDMAPILKALNLE